MKNENKWEWTASALSVWCSSNHVEVRASRLSSTAEQPQPPLFSHTNDPHGLRRPLQIPSRIPIIHIFLKVWMCVCSAPLHYSLRYIRYTLDSSLAAHATQAVVSWVGTGMTWSGPFYWFMESFFIQEIQKWKPDRITGWATASGTVWIW